jgi:hypothetical protein
MPNHGMNMDHRGMTRDSMMGSGCAEMMQSRNNGGDRRPNSQWQRHPPGDATPD